MNSSLIPWKTLSHSVSLGQETEGWTLATTLDLAEGETAGLRTFRYEVFFESAFEFPPVVSVGLAGFDIDQRTSARVRLTTPVITTTGFTLEVSTWLDTLVYGVDFNWLAVGA